MSDNELVGAVSLTALVGLILATAVYVYSSVRAAANSPPAAQRVPYMRPADDERPTYESGGGLFGEMLFGLFAFAGGVAIYAGIIAVGIRLASLI